MEELIPCKIIEPIKFSQMIVAPCPSFDLPRAIAEDQARAGRVQILDAAQDFTPAEPAEGVVEVEQQNSEGAAGQADQAPAMPQPGGGESPLAGADLSARRKAKAR